MQSEQNTTAIELKAGKLHARWTGWTEGGEMKVQCALTTPAGELLTGGYALERGYPDEWAGEWLHESCFWWLGGDALLEALEATEELNEAFGEIRDFLRDLDDTYFPMRDQHGRPIFKPAAIEPAAETAAETG